MRVGNVTHALSEARVVYLQKCMQIIWHAALSSPHHAMRCCHHSVSITRSRLMESALMQRNRGLKHFMIRTHTGEMKYWI